MKIKILKEEIDIQFNMAVELAYEELTGEEFNVESLKKMKNTIVLAWLQSSWQTKTRKSPSSVC